MKSVMLYQFGGPHPSHKNFGDSLDCSYWHFERGTESNAPSNNENSYGVRLKTGIQSGRKFDHIIGEGSATVQSLIPAGIVAPKTDLTLLIADETFLHVSDSVWSILGPLVDRLLDNVVAVSPLCSKWASTHINMEIDIVRPSVNGDIPERLLNLPVEQPEEVNRVICAGSASSNNALWKKNTQVLVEATERANLDLTLLGEGHQNREYDKRSHVRCPGWVSEDQLVDEFEQSDAYILPSNGDAYPVSSLEGMIAGLPTIVSDMTGTKELIDDRFVSGTDVESVTSAINTLCDTPRDDRIKIGYELRKKASRFTEERQAKRFKEVLT